MEDDDLALVSRARAGDPGAFRALVVRYQRKVYAVALGIVKDPDQAWDVAQEAFVRVHQHLAVDSVRRERTRSRDDLEEADEAALAEGGEGILATALGTNPQESALRRELMDKIGEALDRLPEIHRTILVLREVEGLSYDELAERLEISKGTVMSRLFHARRKMQAVLRRYAGLAPAEAPADEATDADDRGRGRGRGREGGGGEGEP